MDEPDSVFIAVLEKYFEKKFDHFVDNPNPDVEGLYVVNQEFRYRIRCQEATHTYRVNVDILRDRFDSFLDDQFRFCQSLYSTRVLKTLTNTYTWRRVATEIIEGMRKSKLCQFCPRLALSSTICSVCQFSYNFEDRCPICHDRLGRFIKLPPCGHRAHAQCISKLHEKKCPVCRAVFI